MHDRMFKVIVLGGIGLVGCGGTAEPPFHDDGGSADAADGASVADASQPDVVFPSELPVILDAGTKSDAFPQEAP